MPAYEMEYWSTCFLYSTEEGILFGFRKVGRKVVRKLLNSDCKSDSLRHWSATE